MKPSLPKVSFKVIVPPRQFPSEFSQQTLPWPTASGSNWEVAGTLLSVWFGFPSPLLSPSALVMLPV